MHASRQLTVTTLEEIGGPAAMVHLHPTHDTVIDVLDGVVYLVLDEDERALTPGDRVTVPAGVAYRFWNAGDDDARVRQEHSSVAPEPVTATVPRESSALSGLLQAAGRVLGIATAPAV